MAPRQHYLTIDIPSLAFTKSDCIILSSSGKDSSYGKDYKKLIKAAAAWAATLGTESFNIYINKR